MSVTLDAERAAECWGCEAYPIGFNDGFDVWDAGHRPRDVSLFAARRAIDAGVHPAWVDAYVYAFIDGYEFAQHPDDDGESDRSIVPPDSPGGLCVAHADR